MQPAHLITLTTSFALTWALGSTLAVLYVPRGVQWKRAGVAITGLLVTAAVLWLDSTVSLGRNSVIHFWERLQNTDPVHLCAALLGFSMGLGPAIWPWQARRTRRKSNWPMLVGRSMLLCSFVLSFSLLSLFSLQDKLKPYLHNRSLGSIVSNPLNESIEPGFLLEEYHVCQFRPVQIEVGPDGCLYATGYKGDMNQYGIVARISQDSASGGTHEAEIARHLNRPHGLAFYKGDLYVSRSGHRTRAKHGVVTQDNTGAVTLLRDTDVDGLMDYYHDVVSDLPGAQGPDELHQNNGIVFGSDGYLYTTVGAHSDRAPTMGPLEGTILRSRSDGSELGVFARGLRNPFDLTIGPRGELFCTDNDASDRRNGDELNHVVEGGHYGFPYADGTHPHPDGTIAPILVKRRGTLQGLAYTECPRLPEEYRNCFYAVSYGDGAVVRIVPRERGDGSYDVQQSEFARVPHALDVTVGKNGTFYVSCFHSKTIYRIRYQDSDS